MSYSIDLREKVIKFLEAGNTQRAASEVFNLSKTTVNSWHRRYQAEGHYDRRKQPGAKPRIEKESFSSYVSEHPNSTSEDIGKVFGMSAGGARYWLKAIGFSYKKKRLPMWKRERKSESDI